jgi:gliding motility-associated-like protein
MKLRAIVTAAVYLLAGAHGLQAQTISGVINDYAVVTGVDFCNNLVAVATINEASQFAPGDKALLIQMTGASISLNDDATYGDINTYNNTGNYEVLTVATVNANIITFQYTMLRNYDAGAGAIQLVRIPVYTDVTINGLLTCTPWDGASGGVLIFEATGDVTFAADIDVSGLGFNAGAVINNTGCYLGGGGYTGYVCSAGNNCGGSKGGGIYLPLADDLGRGAPANGGGGGNDHNTGGGGGGNYGPGGQGGQRLNTSGTQCAGTTPGLGGKALNYSNASNQVFMGGAGGNGDQDTNQGTVGGDGGAIVIISANNINGNGQNIFNRGASALTAQMDGAGGGGAGGSVLIDAASISSALNIDNSGGNGGDVDNGMSADSCFGPGGGGSAGILWVSGASLPATVFYTAGGGMAGLTVNANANAACLNSSNGATNGTAGGSLTGLAIPQSATTYVQLSGTACCDASICSGEQVNITANGSGTGTITYNWDNGTTGSSINVSPTTTITYNVAITDSRGCSVSDNVLITVNGASVTAFANPTTIMQGQGSVLQAQTPDATAYNWFPTDGLDFFNVQSPVASPTVTTTYCVEITSSDGCLDTSCVTVTVIPDTTYVPPPVELFIGLPNAFSPNGDGVNDVFRFSSIAPCEEVISFMVFDRWGRLVNGHNYNSTWDGNNKYGHPFPLGVYTYYTQVRCPEGIVVMKGNVTLVR